MFGVMVRRSGSSSKVEIHGRGTKNVLFFGISTNNYYLSTSTKYLVKKVLKYKYICTTIGWYLSTSIQVPQKYLNTFISTVGD